MDETKGFDDKLNKIGLLRKGYKSAIWALVISLLFYVGSSNYSLFHISIEMYTVVVSAIAYIIVLNTYEISQNSYLTFMGIAFGFVGMFDFIHLITYDGIQVLSFANVNESVQVWVTARLLQSITFITSFIFLKRKINKLLTNIIFLAITAFILLIIFTTDIFPQCFIPSIGTTAFERVCELISGIFFFIGILLLIKFKNKMRYLVYRNLLFSLIIVVIGELMIAFHSGIDNTVMTIGHIFKLIAYYYFYSALIVTTLKSPINMMYYELDRVREELAEKNMEVIHANEQLKQEISDLQMIEKLLRKSKAWSRAIFEGSPIGIVLLNINGVIIETNPAFERIIGYYGDELRNFGIKNITHPDDYEHDKNLYSELISGQIDNYNIEKRYIRKDGHVIWGNLEMSYIQNVGEDFQFLIAMVEDITHKKQNQENQKQLLKELETINQELDSFAYIVSHDLKAPLRGIGSLASWLSNDYADKIDEEGKDIINLMINRVERMKNFIDGILQYSRVSKTNESKIEIDLNKVVKEIIELMAPSDNIAITMENKLPTVRSYRIFMEQVFQNLIGNSIKFMDKPEGTIKIRADEEEAFWKISISDNGPGIEEKYYKKIFQIFQTLQPRDKFESTGIGLSIVKKIIETSGGQIWVESELEKGSTFYFTLPKS